MNSIKWRQEDWQNFNNGLRKLLFAQLRQMGLFAEPGVWHNLTVLRQQAGIHDKYARWWAEALNLLADGGNGPSWVLLDKESVQATMAAAGFDAAAAWREWDSQKPDYMADAELATSVQLVDACLQNLPEILRGKLQVTDILFPRATMEKVENMYQRHAVADYFNGVVADLALAAISQRVKADPEAKIRLIEIGAGTGGTTAMVLPVLATVKNHIEEYCYTDISKAFLLHAQNRYAVDYPYLQTQLWNIEQPLAEQGIAIGSYDIAIATNVLHATRNIRHTLRNAKAALKRNGLLLINEGIQKTVVGTLTFALLDGWWLYEDEELRLSGSPLLSPETWQRVLREEGFAQVLLPIESARELGQQIIVAESDGWIRQTTASPTPLQPTVTQPTGDRQRSATQVTPVSADNLKDEVTEIIFANLAQTLKIATNTLTIDISFSDYGIDSILGAGFVRQINDALGITMNTASIFDHSTVQRLADYLLKTYQGPLAERLGQTAVGCEPEASQADIPLVQPQSERSSQHPSAQGSPAIAVIGMSGQFPCANNVHEFWQNLLDGKSGIGELPAHYLDQPDANYRWGGALAGRDCFDPLFFNIAPREAESMNPHQRLILQESWKALEDACYNPKSLADTQTGLFIGAEPTGYFHESFTGSSDATIASRLSYFLNLKGPALVVNTGCSSSGVALHLACESLRHRESDLALAGGVYAGMMQSGLSVLAEAGILSPDGRCHTFDATANGTVLAEAVGVVVLKRLDDALAAGDLIYGVIVGSGINQDGASNGMTAPNGAAQEALIADIYRRYRISPEQISYVEAHGTATRLGDPVEANALVRAFKRFTARQHYCAVGSAKPAIGHTSASAGVVGLIKILLSLQHKTLPSLLHFQQLNPLIEFADSAFYVNTTTSPWQRRDARQPLMAALSSFGHSGTNAHLVVEEFVHASAPIANSPSAVLVPVSAKNRARLSDYLMLLHAYLQSHRTTVNLPSLAYTLQTRREAMAERAVFLTKNVDELLGLLTAAIAGEASDNYWQSQDYGNKPKGLFFANDEDSQDMLAKWMAKGKLKKLAEGWAQGLNVNWQALYGNGHPQPIRLPTYPFAQERYWPKGKAAPLAEAKIGYLHPLLQQNTSDINRQRYSSAFTSAQFPSLQGQTLLPALACLEMALAALQQSAGFLLDAPTVIQLHHLEWAEPLWLDDISPVHISLFAEAEDIAYEIYGADETSHQQGWACLTANAPAILDLSNLQADIKQYHLNAGQCYEALNALGYVCPQHWQTLVAVQANSQQLLAKLVLPADLAATQHHYTVHPALLEGLIHALSQFEGYRGQLWFPERLQTVELSQPCPAEVWAWLRLNGDSIDIDVCDHQGHVCLHITGLRLRPLAIGKVNEMPMTAWDGLSYLQTWQVQVLPEHTKPKTPALVLVVAYSENAFAEFIAGSYRQQAATVHAILLGSDTRPLSESDWLCGIDDSKGFARCLQDAPTPDCVYFCVSDGSGEFLQAVEASQHYHELQLLRLLKALKHKLASTAFVDCYVLSVDNYRLYDTAIQAGGCGLTGLAYALAQSDHRFLLRNVDLASEDLHDRQVYPHLFRQIVSEPAADRGDVVKLCGGQRYKQAFYKLNTDSAAVPVLKQRGVYVILGGSGTVGRVITRQLLADYQAHVVWLARTVATDPVVQAKLAEFGAAVTYIQADVTQWTTLQYAFAIIKQRFSCINGAIFSGLDISQEQGLAQVSEAAFLDIVKVKTLGSLYFYRLWQDEALDFLCYFSSGQAYPFSGAAKLPAYATGITFADSLVHGLRQSARFPVGIINWGFWQASFADVSGSTPQNVSFLSDQEGFACFKAFLGHLPNGPLRQVLCMRASEPVQQLMAVKAEIVGLAQAGTPISFTSAHYANLVGLPLTNPHWPTLLACLQSLLFAQCRQLGLFTDMGWQQRTHLRQQAGILDKYARWWEEALNLLADDSYGTRFVHIDNDAVQVDVGQVGFDAQAVWQRWAEQKALYLADAELASSVHLADACLQNLPDILRGKLQATEILFPSASMANVENIYQRHAVADYFNGVIADMVLLAITQILNANPSAKIRLIEIGAGTGGTTAIVLPALATVKNHIEEYRYTDISKAFLLHAQNRYAVDYPYLQTQLWNIEQPLAEQGIAIGSYDIAIATNVLHATCNIRHTLGNAKLALKTNGLLIINEGIQKSLLNTLTFGLLDGWWLYEDASLRLPGSPLLGVEQWRQVLGMEGFGKLFWPAQAAAVAGLQVIVAASDGLLKQAVARQTAKPLPLQDIKPTTATASKKYLANVVPTSGGNLKQQVGGIIAEALAISLSVAKNELDYDVPFSDYGIDYILGVGSVSEVSKSLGVTMNTAIIFDYTTVNLLTAYLLDTYRKGLTAR
ncbi:MAG: beta-ketoacyl synthase N-terminal-like domain-containing protein, partial [Methylovulum sp.]|nr:beta-ketoacyl synthase N-terminal-like domain-containing protein [Methylovulum sp.]